MRTGWPNRIVLALAPLALTFAALPFLGVVGPLRGPLLLIVLLPMMARALEHLGWVSVAARPFGRLRPGAPSVLGTYAAWLGLSAFLTLDVAAVVAVPVGIAVARAHGRRGRSQVAAAIVGANVGSMLFPFSNLTNLVLVAGTGLEFGTYTRTALLPQLLAAIGAGLVLARRGHELEQQAELESATGGSGSREPTVEAAPAATGETGDVGRTGRAAAAVAVAGAAATVAVGFAGGDVAVVLGAASALVVGIGLWDGRFTPTNALRAIPWSAVAVIVGAALLRAPIAGFAARLPDPESTAPAVLALPAIALVGGLLAAVANNLPAAAFGAIWLSGASPAAIVAYLLGTNILALVTPHGSVATMLSRALAHRAGEPIPVRDYLWRGWRYAVAGTVPALLVLILLR